MNVRKLMEEFGFEIDDVRWYLSQDLAKQILGFKSSVSDLQEFIWSGRLEDSLYNMEENLLDNLQSQVDRRLIGEPEIREVFYQIGKVRLKRPKR